MVPVMVSVMVSVMVPFFFRCFFQSFKITITDAVVLFRTCSDLRCLLSEAEQLQQRAALQTYA